MERMPPQRRPGLFLNQKASLDECSNSRMEFPKFDSSSPSPHQVSFARGRLMKSVMAYVKPSLCQTKPKDPLPFQYEPKSCPMSCQCERGKKNILCQACGYNFQGRVRTRCPLHPTVIHLMDLEACPNCLATHLKEFSNVQRNC